MWQDPAPAPSTQYNTTPQRGCAVGPDLGNSPDIVARGPDSCFPHLAAAAANSAVALGCVALVAGTTFSLFAAHRRHRTARDEEQQKLLGVPVRHGDPSAVLI